MATRIAFALTVGLALLCSAAGQSLTINDGSGQRAALEVSRLHAEVSLIGNVAKTTVTLKFRNHTSRNQEGEFRMPLPAGATVSSYALEVNGALRESVAVEKERARFAYETIKARNIDPGLVEREAGNIYRTRVFPVPPRGTKELRIGYVEPLSRDADGVLHYQLPMKFPKPVGEFSCRISYGGQGKLEISAADSIKFETDEDQSLRSEAAKVTLDADLKLQWKKPSTSEAYIETAEDGTKWLFASGVFPNDIPAAKLAHPAKIKLLWDASDSAGRIDKAHVYALLDQYFQLVEDIRVDLRLMRYGSAETQKFEIRNGNWTSLRERLESVNYDGTSSYKSLSEPTYPTTTIFLVTDGQTSDSAWRYRRAGGRLFVLNCSDSTLAPAAKLLATDSGGDVVSASDPDALDRLTTARPTIGVTARALRDLEIDFDGTAGSPFRISAKLTNTRADKLSLKFSCEEHIREETVDIRRSDNDVARRLWAQLRLAKMETLGGYLRQTVIDFARKHVLVSEFTSLIVLERFADHVTFRIPPPEPELRKRYEDAIARVQPANTGVWADRLNWHKRSFPWTDIALLEPLQRADIWKKATDQVFTESERDAEGYRRITEWSDAALATIKRRSQIKTKGELDEWKKAVAKLAGESAGFKTVDSSVPATKGSTAVSVQGLVQQPGKLVFEKPTTLSEAISQAGGPLQIGSENHVTLYRKAAKVTFNMFSKDYKPVFLRSGDMIVLRPAYTEWSSGGGDFFGDPFSSGSRPEPVSPRDLPAIVNEDPATEWVNSRATDRFGGSSDAMKPLAQVTSRPEKDTFPELAAFIESFDAGEDPQQAYLTAKGKKPRGTNFFIQSARALFARGHQKLGRQVLSNLIEHDHSPVAARTFVLWLIEFEQWDAAQQLCAQLADHENLAIAEAAGIDSARAYERSGELTKAAQQYQRLINLEKREIDTLASFALTERNSLFLREPKESGLRRAQSDDFDAWINLDADIRIVLTSDMGRVSLVITDPLGKIVKQGKSSSPSGARLSESGYHQEFMIKQAIPGTYKITCQNRGVTNPTAQVGVFTDWGRPDQEVEWRTVQMDLSRFKISNLEFELPDE